MLGATFHLFSSSFQTPLHDPEEKNNHTAKTLVQNAIGNETLAATMYEVNPNHLYPQVHLVNNPMSISSNLIESPRNDPTLVYPLGNVARIL